MMGLLFLRFWCFFLIEGFLVFTNFWYVFHAFGLTYYFRPSYISIVFLFFQAFGRQIPVSRFPRKFFWGMFGGWFRGFGHGPVGFIGVDVFASLVIFVWPCFIFFFEGF